VTPLAFPATRPHGLRVQHDLFVHALVLRGAVDADLPALRELYSSTRTEELAAAPWSQAAKDQFIGQQFSLQHHHYLANYRDADFLVIEAGAELVGRFYHWSAPDGTTDPESDRVIDVSLMPRWRGRGLGGALLRAAMVHAASRGRGVTLHVHRHNDGARRLYERLGFVIAGDAGLHMEMLWLPKAASPSPSRTPPRR
jgi:ribosomal protein S18 acetylase RimI-like enzyme